MISLGPRGRTQPGDIPLWKLLSRERLRGYRRARQANETGRFCPTGSAWPSSTPPAGRLRHEADREPRAGLENALVAEALQRRGSLALVLRETLAVHAHPRVLDAGVLLVPRRAGPLPVAGGPFQVRRHTVAAPEQPGEIVARRGPAVAARALEVRQDPLAGGGVAVLAGVRELLLFLVTRALFREAGAFAQEQQVTFGVRALVLVPGEAQAELGRRVGLLGPAELEQDPGACPGRGRDPLDRRRATSSRPAAGRRPSSWPSSEGRVFVAVKAWQPASARQQDDITFVIIDVGLPRPSGRRESRKAMAIPGGLLPLHARHRACEGRSRMRPRPSGRVDSRVTPHEV